VIVITRMIIFDVHPRDEVDRPTAVNYRVDRGFEGVCAVESVAERYTSLTTK